VTQAVTIAQIVESLGDDVEHWLRARERGILMRRAVRRSARQIVPARE
jgi:hypothetical protein